MHLLQLIRCLDDKRNQIILINNPMKQVLQHAHQQAVIAQLLDQNLFLMPVTQNSIAKNMS